MTPTRAQIRAALTEKRVATWPPIVVDTTDDDEVDEMVELLYTLYRRAVREVEG